MNASTMPTGTKPRYRVRFDFRLNILDDSEQYLADELEYLKTKRQFLPTIRKALFLILDLNAGRTDELYKLFPHLKPKTASDEFNAILAEIRSIKSTPMQPVLQSVAPTTPTPNQPKPMTFKKVAFAPEEDLDLESMIEVKQTEGSGKSAENLIKSAFAIVKTVSAEDIAARKKAQGDKKGKGGRLKRG